MFRFFKRNRAPRYEYLAFLSTGNVQQIRRMAKRYEADRTEAREFLEQTLNVELDPYIERPLSNLIEMLEQQVVSKDNITDEKAMFYARGVHANLSAAYENINRMRNPKLKVTEIDPVRGMPLSDEDQPYYVDGDRRILQGMITQLNKVIGKSAEAAVHR